MLCCCDVLHHKRLLKTSSGSGFNGNDGDGDEAKFHTPAHSAGSSIDLFVVKPTVYVSTCALDARPAYSTPTPIPQARGGGGWV